MADFPYTDEERHRIERALDAIKPTQSRRSAALKFALSAGIEEEDPDWSEISRFREEQVGLVDGVIHILRTLSHESNYIASESEKVISHLQNIRKWMRRWSNDAHDSMLRQDHLNRIRPPNSKPFRDNLYLHTVVAWSSAGGSVDGGKKFRVFFEAVVKPVLNDKSVQARHNIAWSPSSFRGLIRHWNDMRGESGKRGRPAKNAVLD